MSTHVDGTAWKIPLVALLALDCNDGHSPNTKLSDTDGTDDTNAPPTASAVMPTDDGAATDTAGGSSHAVCDRYLACIAATTPAALPAAQMGYAENGTCWQAGTDAADLCLGACRVGLMQYHDLYPGEPACEPCAADDECDAAAGEVCSSAHTCVPLCVDELPGGCLCRVDGDCVGDHVCVDEDCRTSLTCGDGKVDASEICDGQVGCNAGCDGPPECSPVTNLGCAAGQICHIDGACMDAPGDLPGNGEECMNIPSKVTCAAGYVCESGYYDPDCGFDACCKALCNFQGPDDCPVGTYCNPGLDLIPQFAYIGICV